MQSKTRILELQQGVVEYECTPIDEEVPQPTGAVFLHHGLVGGAGILDSSRLAARAHNLALVTVSRPGYGESEPIRMSSIGEWVSVLSALADHLEIERFAVGGFSAGAPYAYASAALLPERVSCVAICSGLPFLHDDTVFSTYPVTSQDAFRRIATATLEEVCAKIVPLVEQWTSTTEPTDPRYRFVQATLAANGMGPGREAWLQMQSWGFDLGEVRQPVGLWHHPKDPQVPFASAERMAEKLSSAQLVTLDDPQTHGPTPTSFDRMLAWIVAQAKS